MDRKCRIEKQGARENEGRKERREARALTLRYGWRTNLFIGQASNQFDNLHSKKQRETLEMGRGKSLNSNECLKRRLLK